MRIHVQFALLASSEEDLSEMSDDEDTIGVGSPTSVGGKVYDDAYFRRGLGSSTSLTRISAIIRRSLRLPTRRSGATLATAQRAESRRLAEEDQSGPRFTRFSEIRSSAFPAYPSRLDEIKECRRLNRQSKKDTPPSPSSLPPDTSTASKWEAPSGMDCPLSSSDYRRSSLESRDSGYTDDSEFGSSLSLNRDVPTNLSDLLAQFGYPHTSLKQIVRKANWPVRHEVRKELWKELCRDKSYDASASVYKEEVASAAALNEARALTPNFLKEEGAVMHSHFLAEDGVVQLTRLLALLEQLRPDINSAPILFPLCALFMHYLPDEDTYACAQFLARSGQEKNPPVHLLMTSVQWDASPHVLLALVKKYKPNAYALLKRKSGNLDDDFLAETLREWKQWLFQWLPLSHIVRIVDCFLVEGHKFLLRSAIAVIYMWSKIHKRSGGIYDGRTEAEKLQAIRTELQNAAMQCQVSSETFLEMAILIKNLKSSTIARLQTQFEKKVREDRESGKGQHLSTSAYYFTKAFKSKIISTDFAKQLMARLPSRHSLVTPQLLFTLSQDGASFTHLWSKIDESDQSLMIFRSAKGDVFGAYCSASWAERNDRRERTKSKYFGTGESFVFRVSTGGRSQVMQIFGWVGGNNNNQPSEQCPQMFMAAGDRLLVIGSGDGDAIRVSEELTRGISSACTTFNSPALVEDRAFEINELEVFGVITST